MVWNTVTWAEPAFNSAYCHSVHGLLFTSRSRIIQQMTLMGMAYDAGINFFDNAEAYAGGESELMMGRVLKNKQLGPRLILCGCLPKCISVCRGKDNKPNQHGLGRKHFVEACHAAIERMQTGLSRSVFCHRPDPNVPIEEVVWTMHNLILQGKILYWGTSQWSGAEIMEAHRVAQQYRTDRSGCGAAPVQYV